MRIGLLWSLPTQNFTTVGTISSDDQVHDLDQRVDGRAGGVLERVTDRCHR